ncbi:uncharacterized protein PAC_15462 [Phialocephala subalpina]|uniref:4-coumarate--CoA ligase n=1 Tax=Phialocephala subalpina TaxID=576137 RepID=A0A1L7XKJ6_9HELO|nr:uncharacterized protein PAC_15462 [Phialocephala subalpina]
MSQSNVIVSAFSPYAFDEQISIPEFMTKYNPDDVSYDKVVHVDTITGKSITYGGLRQEAAKCAWGLRKLSLRVGDTVLILSSFAIRYGGPVQWSRRQALIVCGLQLMSRPVNTASTAKDLAHAFGLVKPKYIATSAAFIAKVREAIELVEYGEACMRPNIISVLDRIESTLKFPEDVVGKRPDEALAPYSLGNNSAKETVALICFSSGTTGKMKGVQLTHYSLNANVHQYRTSFPSQYNCHQSEVFFPPYCHIYGLSTVILLGMWLGTFTCALPAFELGVFCQKMEQYKATWAHVVPPVALSLASSDVPLKYNLSTLECVVVAAAPLKKALQTMLKTRFPSAVVVQGKSIATLKHDEDNLGTCGRLFAGTEARLVNPETGKDVARGEEGELWVRGPQVMLGYVGDESATRNTFSGDWLKTGDIMTMDEKNNFYVTDRLKEMIKFQIAPSELEDLLLRHPHVIDAAVCAIYDDDQASEVPLAYVSLIQEYAMSPHAKMRDILDGIRNWLNSRVAGYKKLRGGVFHLQELPKTNSGKLLRKNLPAKLKEIRESRM